jgi:hypothetical protein
MKHQTKQVVIHLQVTTTDGHPVYYAEGITDTGQRCGMRGPYDSEREEETLRAFLSEFARTLSDRVTFSSGATLAKTLGLEK